MHERPARPSVATIVTMVIVGAAAWLSFGVLAIADDGGARIGVLPRVALLALALLIAVSAATLSRLSSRAALPLWLCLLVILPWIPLPVPELFLVWTGPAVLFVWGGIALCMVAVAAAERGARLPALFRDARRAPRCAGVLAFVACVSVGLAAKGPPRGDEPHYLLIVQSLLKDGDLEIANNYERRDYLEYWPGPLRPHFSRPASNGDLYSGHAPGVAALVAPAFAIGGYRGAGLWLAVLTSLGSMFVWRAGHIFTRDAGAAWFGWSAVVLTAPIVLHGTLVYPDAIAAVMLAAGTLAVVSLRDVCRASRHTGAEAGRPARWPPGHSFLIGVPVALLPWLHTRLAVPAALLGLVLFLRFGTAVRCRAVTWRDVALFATPIVVGLGGWFAFFRVTFGTFNPSAQHGGDVPLAVEHIPLGLVSVLADQEFGLLVNAPVHILWLAGVWSVFQRDRRLATELLVIVALMGERWREICVSRHPKQ